MAKKKRFISDEELAELGVTSLDDEERQAAEDILEVCERFGNALFYTFKAAMSPASGGHDRAMYQWRELGKAAIKVSMR